MNDENTKEVQPYRLSNSEIQVFKDCRRKWWLNYYRRLQPKQKDYTGALALGSRIHEALDQYYSQGIPLLEAHAALVKKDMETLVAEYRDTSDLESEAELGRIMLEGYLQWVEDEGQ
jgi:RecB family exonuclease